MNTTFSTTSGLLDAELRMNVSPNDFKYQVALGKIAGYSNWNKFGYNGDVDIGGNVIMASFGGTWSPLTSASTLTIVSTDVNDTSGGSGANSIVIYGIDGSYDEQTEIVVLNGTTNVVTTSTWLGINRAAIYLAGTGMSNAGDINITATTGGTYQAQIPTEKGTTQQLIFHVPNNDRVALADWLFLNAQKLMGTNPIVTFTGWVYSSISNAKYEIFQIVIDTSSENTVQLNPSQPFVIGTASTFWIEASTNNNNTVVTGRFSLVLATP